MRRSFLALLVAFALAAEAAGCRRAAQPERDPVGVLKSGARPAFQAPVDGLLKPQQVDLFLKVRLRARTETMAQALAAAGSDPAEYGWVRARIQEALLALDADRVAAASSESYTRAIAALRQTRKSAPDAKTGARLDAEIATLERERASLRKSGPASASLKRNAALVSQRRAQIEAAGP